MEIVDNLAEQYGFELMAIVDESSYAIHLKFG
jgi:hypothetical protein